MKRLSPVLSILLACMMLLCTMPVNAFAAMLPSGSPPTETAAPEAKEPAPKSEDPAALGTPISGTGLEWEIADGGVLIISGTGTIPSYSNNAPWKNRAGEVLSVVIGDGIVGIGNNAFQNCSSLTSVSIGTGLTSVSEITFNGCTALTSITVAAGNAVFYATDGVLFQNEANGGKTLVYYPAGKTGTYTMPNDVTQINSYAFYNVKGLTGVTLGSSVTAIRNYAFFSCPALVSVALDDALISIGTSAFSGCSSLASVSLPASFSSLGDGVFTNCTALEAINVDAGNPVFQSVDGVLFRRADHTLLHYPLHKSGESYTAPADTLNIAKNAFDSCQTLHSVTLPDGLLTIGEGAFQKCSSLTSVSLGSHLTSIGSDAFTNCAALSSIAFPDTLLAVGNNAFQNCSSLSSVVLPDGITSLGSNLFRNCSSLASVTLPAELVTISSSAFQNCPRLDNVVFPAKLATIGSSAFQDCTKLSSVALPDSLRTLNSSAFQNCSSLETLDLGNGITSVSSSCFQDCVSLTAVTLPDQIENVGSHAFDGCKAAATVQIGAGLSQLGDDAFYGCSALTAFSVSDENDCFSSPDDALVDEVHHVLLCYPAKRSATSYSVPAGILTVKANAFRSCATLQQVTLSDSVKTIGESAFRDCTALSGVQFGAALESVGAYAFYGCSALSTALLADGVKSIGTYAFYGCRNLVTVSFGTALESIGAYAFCNASSLLAIQLPDSLLTLDANAFQGCSKLSSAYIGSSLQKLSSYLFSDCALLVTVTGGTQLTEIGNNAFQNCAKLADFAIPAGVSKIGTYAFSGCASLASVTVPAGVKEIGAYTFQNCAKLASAVLPSGLTSIGNFAFYKCSALERVILPDNLKTIGESAFNSCTQLGKIRFGSGITTIGTSAFYSCAALTELVLPASLTGIGGGAFQYCSALQAVYFGQNLSTIGNNAFQYCPAITEITFYGDRPQGISASAFSGLGTAAKAATAYYPAGNDTWDPLPAANWGGAINLSFTEGALPPPSIPVTVTDYEKVYLPDETEGNSWLVTLTDETNGYTFRFRIRTDRVTLGTTFTSADLVTADSYGTNAKGQTLQYVSVSFLRATKADGAETVTATVVDTYDDTYLISYEGGPIRTVTFDLQGHGGTAPAAEIVSDGDTVLRPTDPYERHYLFGGWYLDEDCLDAWNFDEDTVTDDITLFAKWTDVPLLKFAYEADAFDGVYDGNAHSLSVTITSQHAEGATVSYRAPGETQYAGTAPSFTAAGTYVVMVKLEHEDFETLEVPVSVVIAPLPVVLEWGTTSFTYDRSPHLPTVTVTGLLYGDACTATVSGAASDAGEHTATVTALSNPNYAIPEDDSVTFTIAQIEIGLTFSGTTVTYDGTSHIPSARATGVLAGDECLVYVSGAQTAAGTYTATAYDLSNDNYKLPDVCTTEFTIQPATVTVSGIAAHSKAYDGNTEAELDYDAVVITGMIEGDDLGVTAVGTFDNADAGENKTVRITGITLTGTAKGNYVLAAAGHQTSTTASISVIAIEATVTSCTCTYDGNGHTVTVEVTDPATGYVVKYGATPGVYDLDELSFTEAGVHTVYYKITAKNYADKTGSATVTIEKAASSVTAPPTPVPGLVYNGGAQRLLDAGTAEGGSFLYSLNGSTWSDTIPSVVSADVYVVYYKVAGDGNHLDTAPATVEAALSPAEIGISWSDLSFVYDKKPHAPTATATGLFGKDTCTLTVSGARTNAGTGYTATVTMLSNPNYKLPEDVTHGFDILPRPVVVSGITAEDKDYDHTTTAVLVYTGAVLAGKQDGDDLSVTATGRFEDANVGEGKRVFITELALTGDAKGNYKLAEEGQQTETTASIREISITATVTDYTGVYDGDAHGISILISDPTEGYVIKYGTAEGTYDLDALTYQNVGTYTVYYFIQAQNYADMTGHATVTITRADSSFAVAPALVGGLVYDGTPQALITAGTAVGGTVQYSTDGETWIGTVPTGTAAGNYSVYYRIAGDRNHNDLESESFRFSTSIGKRTVGIDWGTLSFVYDGDAHLPAPTATDLCDGDECTLSVIGEQTAVGSYQATVVNLSNTNYKLPAGVAQTFEITPRPVTVSGITAKNKQYDGLTAAELVLTGAVLTGKLPGESLGITATGTFEDANAGTGKRVFITELTLTGEDKDNYMLAEEGQQTETTADIAVSHLAYTAGNYSGTYDGQPHGILLSVTVPATGATVKYGTEEGVYTLDELTYEDVGTYTVYYSIHAANYADETGYATVTITAAPSQLTKAPAPLDALVYNGGDQPIASAGTAIGGKVQYSLNGEIWSDSVPMAKNANAYTVYYRVKGDRNHTDVNDGAFCFVVSILPKTVGIEWGSLSIVYNGQARKPAPTATGLYGQDTCTFTVTVTEPSPVSVGEYHAAVTDLSNKNYCLPEDVFCTFNVVPCPVVISGIAAQDKNYDGSTAATLVYTGVVITGKVSEDDLSVTAVGTFDTADAGNNKVVSITNITLTGKDKDNYVLAASGQQTQTRAAINAIAILYDAEGYEGDYDGQPHTITLTVTNPATGYTVKFGTQEDECTLDALSFTTAGTHTVYFLIQAPNHTDTSGSATVVIRKVASAVVTAPTAVPGLVYDGTEQALVQGGTAEGGSFAYRLDDGEWSGNVPEMKNAGDYLVYYKVAGDENHLDAEDDGYVISVSVGKRTVGIDWGTLSFVYNGKAQLPAPTATGLCDGDTCTFTVTGEAIAAGEHTATVTDLSNGNYQLPETATTAFAITPRPVIVSGITAKNKQYDGTTTATLSYTDVVIDGIIEGDELTVSATGAFEDPNAGEGKTVRITGITLGGKHKDNYVLAGEGQQTTATADIAMLLMEVSATGYEGDYDGDAHTITVSVTDPATGYTVKYGTAADDCTLDALAYTDAGTYTVYYKVTAANYATETGSATVVIRKVASAVVAAPTAVSGLVYDGAEHALVQGGEAAGGSFAYRLDGGDWSSELPEATSAGDYTVYYKVAGDKNHLDDEDEGYVISVTVGQKEVFLQWSLLSFVYDGEEHAPTAIALGLCGDDVCGVTVSGEARYVGHHTATATALTNGNYKLPASATQEFEITKASVTVSGIQANGRPYDGTTAVTFDYTGVVITGMVMGDELSVLAEGAFRDVNVGEDKPVDITKLTLTGKDAGNYELAAEGQQTVSSATIVPKLITAHGEDYAGTYDGDAHTITVVVEDPATGYTVKFGAAADECTLDALSYINAGEYTVYFTVSAPNYTTVSGSAVVKIEQAESRVVTPPEAVSGLVYNGEPQTLITAGTPYGGEMEYSLDGTTWDKALPKATDADEYAVWYRVKGDRNHTDTTPATVRAVIAKAQSSLTLAPVPAEGLIYNGTAQTLLSAAGTAEGGTVQYRIGTTGGWSNSLPESKAAGTYLVTYKVAGDRNHLDTEDESFVVSCTIGKATVGLSWSSLSFVYDGTQHKPTATATDLYGSDACSVTVTGAQSAAGTHTATATALSNANYQLPAECEHAFEITPRPVVVSGIKAKNKIFDGTTDAVLTYEEVVIDGKIAGDRLSVTATGAFEDASAGENKVVYITDLTLTGEDRGNYKLADEGQQTTTAAIIIPKDIEATIQGYNAVYDGDPHGISVTVADPATGYVIRYGTSENNCTQTSITYTDAGTYTVYYKITAENYKDMTGSATVVIRKAQSAVTVSPVRAEDREYDAKSYPLLTAGEATGGTLQYRVNGGAWGSEVPAALAAGEYAVSYRVAGDRNHENAESDDYRFTITVSQKTVGLSFGTDTFVYDGEAHLPQVTVTGLCEDDVCTATVEGERTDAGSGVATVTGLSNANYRLPAGKTHAFTVSRREITVSGITAKDKIYDGTTEAELVLSSATLQGKLAKDDLAVTATGAFEDENAGENKTVRIVGLTLTGEDKDNYTLAASQQTTTTAAISPRQVEASAEGYTGTYDGEAHAITVTVTVPVSGYTVLYGTTEGQYDQSALSFRDAGEYTVYYKVTAPNYAAATGSATVVIAKAASTLETAPEVISGRVYNGTAQTLVTAGTATGGTVEYSTDGIAWSGTPFAAANAGTYVIRYRVTGDRNHENTESDTFVLETAIAQAEVGIFWSSLSPVYNGKPQTPVATATGLYGQDECAVTVSGAKTDAGTGYVATATALSNDNYRLPAETTQAFEILPCPVTVSGITAKNKIYDGTTAAELVYTGVVIDGMAEGDKVTVSATGTFDTPDIGEQKTVTITGITLSGEDKDNYVLAPKGQQTETAADVTVKTATVEAQDYEGTYDGNTHTVSVTVTDPASGYTVTYGTVKGTYGSAPVLFKDAGEYTVYFKVTAPNYADYEGSAKVRIAKAESTLKTAPEAIPGLVYNAGMQTLVTAGETDDGEILYSFDGAYWFSELPEAGQAGSYTVSYKIVGDKNHEDNADESFSVPVSIARYTVGISWSDLSFTYDRTPHLPTATATGLLGGDTCTVTVSGEQISAGTGYVATAVSLSNPNYKLPDAATTTFDVAPLSVTVSGITAKDKVYDGTAAAELDFSLVVIDGVVEGDDVSVTATGTFGDENVGNDKTVIISGITLSGKDKDNYVLAGEGQQTETAASILEKPVSASAADYEGAYDGKPHTITVTVTDPVNGYTVLFGTEEGVYGSEPITFTDAGEYTVYYKVTAPNYGDTTGSAKVTITRAESTFTVAPEAVSGLVYNGEAQPLITAGTTEDGTVEYSTDGETWVAGLPTGKDAGSYVAYCRITGDKNHLDKVLDPLEITISQAEVTLSFAPVSFVYDGAPHLPAATATGLYGDDECLVTVTGEKTAAGTGYVATATELSNPNYKLPEATTATFDITPRPVIVSGITAENKIYDGTTAATLVFTGAVIDGKVDGDAVSVSATGTFEDPNAGEGKTIRISGITLTGDDKDNYVLAGEGQQTTTTASIAPKQMTVSAEDYDGTYDGKAHTVTVTVSDPETDYTVKFGTAEGECTQDALPYTNAGTYTVYFKVTAANYVDYEGSATVTIAQASLTVTAENAALVYGDAPAPYTVRYDGFVNGEDESVLSGTLAFHCDYVQYANAGTYALTCDGLDSGNYEITYLPGTVTVSQKEITVSFSSLSFVYDGEPHLPTATAEGLLNGDACTVNATGAQTAAGTGYVATAVSLSNPNYKLSGTLTATFSIDRAPLTVTAKPSTIVYGDAPDHNGVIYTGFVPGDTAADLSGKLTFTYTYRQYGNVGEYELTPGGVSSPNYDITFVGSTLTVKQKTVTLKWGNSTFTYDGKSHLPTATALGLCNGDVCKVTVRGVQTNAGKYTATVMNVSNSNYKLPTTDLTHTFVINKAPLTVFTDDVTTVYGDELVPGTVRYDGFVPGESAAVLSGTAALTTDYRKGSDAGTYAITPGGVSAQNYEITFRPGTVTVLPRPVGIEWQEELSFAYDGQPHAPAATVTGVLPGDECRAVLDAESTGTEAGTYTATVAELTNPNYRMTKEESVRFTIRKAPLTVTAQDLTIVYGEMPEGFTATYSGFIRGEDESVLSGTLSFSCVYRQYGNVGVYTVTPGGVSSPNYDIVFVPARLTVNRAPVTITVDNKQSIVGDPFEPLSYTVTEGSFFDGDEQDLALFRETGTQIGYYSISTTLFNGNYDLTVIPGTYTIMQKSIKTMDASDSGIVLISEKGQFPDTVAEIRILNAEDYRSVDLSLTMGDDHAVLSAYDISMSTAGVSVQPNGTMQVRIPIPVNLQENDTLGIVALNRNGVASDMKATREGNVLVFTTDRVSVFAITGVVPPEVPLLPIVMISAAVVAIAACSLIVVRVSKEEKHTKKK